MHVFRGLTCSSPDWCEAEREHQSGGGTGWALSFSNFCHYTNALFGDTRLPNLYINAINVSVIEPETTPANTQLDNNGLDSINTGNKTGSKINTPHKAPIGADNKTNFLIGSS